MTRYPSYRGPRLSLAEAERCGGGPVAGRFEPDTDGTLAIRDGSARLVLAGIRGARAAAGDWIAGRLARQADGSLTLEQTVVLVPCRGPAPDPDLGARLPLLAARAAIVAAARGWFRDHGFLEVETPVRVDCPGLEPHLRAFPSGERWLITSPELHLKRLLAAGAERVVEFARAFRDDERGAWHGSEFLLLEWYRACEGLAAIEADCEALVVACAEAAPGGARELRERCDLTPPFGRTTVRQAIAEHTGIDLAELTERSALAAVLRERELHVAEDDGWDELFFRLWIAEVEPQLGRERPLFVHDWPASQAALARVRPDPVFPVAERFELYVDGIEVANAFDELNDPDEQRRRHLADQAARRAAGAEIYPLDERFLAALAWGMPPAAGIALGLDRLVALLTGAASLDRIVAFP